MTTEQPDRIDTAPVLKCGEVSDAIAHIITKGMLVCGVLVVFALVQLLRIGASYDHAWLLLGSIASAITLFGYPMLVYAKGRRGLMWMVLPLSGLVPYVLGCYLVFYKGLWGLREGLSALVLLRTITFVVLGYQLVVATYHATEFVRSVDEKRLRIE